MKVTSSEAAKMLKKLENDLNDILNKESQSISFVAAIEEDVEKIRPEYDYRDTQVKVDELEEKIRSIKHAINVFNSTQRIEEFDMTIDQMLIFLPQLTRRCQRLKSMKSTLPMTRELSYNRNSNFIEYRYANYDIAETEKDYDKYSDLLARAQLALDNVNNTVTFEVDI